ncbi:MAG: cysteine desulfurase [Armatimonadetes bacterium]|nr:cysteine desulfurase [Armatimonadota bacterium]
MTGNTVYLDWAASTPLRPEALKVLQAEARIFANPSSPHTPGREARERLEAARAKVARALGAEPIEIFFTGGATESCNMAIKGAIFAAIAAGRKKPHIVTSAFEHHAVLEPVEWLQKMGLARATIVEPDTEGIVAAERIVEAVTPDTVLVSLMLVNNEVGTIQPVGEVARLLGEINRSRETPVLLHTDATQGVPYVLTTVRDLGVDMLSLSGHKFGAPKGVGALYKRKGVRIQPLLHGGSHERGLRAGTENFLSICAMAEALEATVAERPQEKTRLEKLRAGFESELLASIPRTEINGHRQLRSPHVSNIYFADLEAEALLVALDVAGIAVTSGSACTSEKLGSSHVLMSMFHDQKRSDGSLRFSFGWETTQDHVDTALEVLSRSVEKLRLIAGRV